MKQESTPLFIFQNYFSPYRHKLFNEIGKRVALTVVYMQKPHEEGRKWAENKVTEEKNYETIQLRNKHISKIPPLSYVIWVLGLKELTTKIPNHAKIIFLDNLPTNFTTFRLFFLLARISRKNRLLWNEHILPKGTDNWLKILYKKFFTFYFAKQVNTIISFSQMNSEYLKSLNLPFSGQKIIRTIQATYTESEIIEYAKGSNHTNLTSLTFGYLGYFSKRKGIKQLLTAINYYKNPQAHFLFAGDGPLKNEIKKAALKDSRIRLKSYIVTEKDKTEFFNELDFHVVASERDPWCLVVNEAASRGVPSIVSPAVGAKELITLIDKSLVLQSNESISIAKAFVDAEILWRNREKMTMIRARTHKIAALWSIEQAASVFITLATR
ncbi:glycosyltransferase family 4 protein [bacterium]|nr:glycosyltransferase family 4 protein [bacterium]